MQLESLLGRQRLTSSPAPDAQDVLDDVSGGVLLLLVELYARDERVDVPLRSRLLQLVGQDGHQQGGRAHPHETRLHGDESPAVAVRSDVAVADGEEGDGDEPHGVQNVALLVGRVVVGLARAHSPAVGHEEHADYSYQHRPRPFRHERLKNKRSVNLDFVERAYALRGHVLSPAAVHDHELPHQIQPQQHQNGQYGVHRDFPFLAEPVLVRDDDFAREGVNRAHEELDDDPHDLQRTHRQPPVLVVVVRHRELHARHVVRAHGHQQDDGADGHQQLQRDGHGRVLLVNPVDVHLVGDDHQRQPQHGQPELDVHDQSPPVHQLLAPTQLLAHPAGDGLHGRRRHVVRAGVVRCLGDGVDLAHQRYPRVLEHSVSAHLQPSRSRH